MWLWLACAPNRSGALIVEQVNVDPIPNWRAESPVVDQQCAQPPACVRVGCTVRNLGRDPGHADVRFVLDTRPEPLEGFQTVQLGAGEKKPIAVEFADVPLEVVQAFSAGIRTQTFGRCELMVTGTRVTCWVKNPTAADVRFGLTARLLDARPPGEQSGSFLLHPGESRAIPFSFDQRGRLGACEVQ